MITKITLENFKIFTKARFDTEQITIFTGPNGSGKSTIINALMVIQQLKHGQALSLNGDNMKIDSVDDTLNTPDSLMHIGLEGIEKTTLKNPIEKTSIREIYFSVKAGFSGINLVDLENDIYTEDVILEGEFRNKKRISGEQSIRYGSGNLMVQPQFEVYTPFTVAASSGLNETMINRGTKYLNNITGTIQRVIDNIEFIPANRGFSLPGYPIDDKAIDPFQITKPSWEYERDMATTLAYRRDDLENIISNWMKEITGIKISAPLGIEKLVQIMAKQAKIPKSKAIKIAYEGFGSNQLLFILIPLAQSKDNSTLVVEEPEEHLHPKAQASLTRRLLQESKEHNKQLILTTHSEHIIASVLTGIAEKVFSSRDVAIYYLNRRGQTTTKKRLRIDNRGRVEGGLPGFFDANIQEAERHLRALENNK